MITARLALLLCAVACSTTDVGAAPPPVTETAPDEHWTRIERPALLGVQRLLAHGMNDDALLLARARLAQFNAHSGPERMWLHIYEGIALDRQSQRDGAVAAYTAARALHPHPVAVGGIDAPILNLRHIKDFEERHASQPNAHTHRAVFTARMQLDRDRYGEEGVQRIEELYQVSNKQPRTDVARATLEELLRSFPDSNRAGCGALYLAQWAALPQRADLLREVAARHADAIYGDGVQVGAYATWQLAHLVESDEERERLLAELDRRWPDAVDHAGQPLRKR